MKKMISMLAVAALFALSTACGNPAGNYVGLYSGNGTMIGTINTSDGAQTDTAQISGNFNVFEGASSDLIVALSPSCSVPFNMDDYDVASVVPGSTCSVSANGLTYTKTYNTGTIRFDSKIATVSTSGTLSFNYDGSTVPGTFNETITLNKISK